MPPETKKPSGSSFPSRHLLPTEGLESQGLKALIRQCGDINNFIVAGKTGYVSSLSIKTGV